eukprot:GEMP01024318.1.p1 GENE.GEMP01024318.1~~GEMP01024318.1.p1  ORF type:complete len:487 (+),score=117.30 GEMP01024318.1:125-1585(+)
MVTLDQWDSHLDCAISDDGLEAMCLHTDGFQYMWKGARSTHGAIAGTYMFEVKVIENLRVVMPETSARNQNILRVGCSLPLSSLFLGDSAESYGWGGTGKKSTGGKFLDFGGAFGAGDVIGVIMDVDNLSVSFTKNGKFMGTAFSNIAPAAKTTGLFPHILMKNVRVQVNFSKDDAWFPAPSNVYFLDEATSHSIVDNPVDHPRRLEEAEFIMMVGLPACGKTYWALKHMEENPRKNYTLLGTNTVIDQMKVVGLSRKGNYAERWQELISQATPVFNKLCEIAGKTTRHIILDQTNVFGSARGRKVSEYKQFGERRAVVIVNDENTLQQRTEKREREEGKFVPEDAVMGMKQNFTMPQFSEGFTHIDYVEIPEQESRGVVRAFNDAGWDYKRRVGKGKGKGNKPQKPLHTRDCSDLKFDRHGFRERQDQNDADLMRPRSRSPMRRPTHCEGASGGKGWKGGKGGDKGKGEQPMSGKMPMRTSFLQR